MHHRIHSNYEIYFALSRAAYFRTEKQGTLLLSETLFGKLKITVNSMVLREQ